MEIREALKLVSEGGHLSFEQAQEIFLAIFKGGANPDQVGALLMGLKLNGESPEEIAGLVKVLRTKAVKFKAPKGTIDICGTGGDGLNTLNISTAAAFVVAACGVPVAKHGNRAVSSACGSADVLEALGVRIEVLPSVMEACLAETNFAFLFAPQYHPVLKEIGPIRRNLGFRTIFNLAGPLASPAQVRRQLIGVSDKALLGPFAKISEYIGLEQAMIVHAEDGMDEISISAPTHVATLNMKSPKKIKPTTIYPLKAIKGGDAKYNATAIRKLFLDEGSEAFAAAVVANAAAGLMVAGKYDDMKTAYAAATEILKSRSAYALLNNIIEITNEYTG